MFPFSGELGIPQNSFFMVDYLCTFVKIRGQFQGLLDIGNAEVKISHSFIVGSILKFLLVSALKEMHRGLLHWSSYGFRLWTLLSITEPCCVVLNHSLINQHPHLTFGL